MRFNVIILTISMLTSVYSDLAKADEKGKYFFSENYADQFANWRADSIKLLGGKSLSQMADDKSLEIYRFFYSPSFTPDIMFTVKVDQNGVGMIETISADLLVGDDAVLANKVHSKRLDDPELKELRALINDDFFWNAPAKVSRLSVKTDKGEMEILTVLDGTAWIIEALRNGQYQVIYRHSPSPVAEGYNVDEDHIKTYHIGDKFRELSGVMTDEIKWSTDRFADLCENEN